MKMIKSFDDFLESLSRIGLILGFGAILILSVGSIVMRWLGSSLMWVDPLTRHLVFCCAFFGGSLATKAGVHIRIDLVSKLLERAKSRTLKFGHRLILLGFSFIVCLILSKASWDFYLSEKEFGSPDFLGIHSSYLVGIIFVGVGLIALRFLNQILMAVLPGEEIEHSHL
jgi:TRAP-type C4-dicarboxylate transport system permease small subunit